MPPKTARKRAASRTPSSKQSSDGEDWKSKTVAVLRDACNERGLDTSGTKAVLIQRLTEYDDAEDEAVAVPAKLKKQESKNTQMKNAFAALKTTAKSKVCKPVKVDECYPKSGEVHEDYACMLNQTNIGQNNNKFYVIQLIKSGRAYDVFTRWGRVGEGSQQAVHSGLTLEKAIVSFKKKFKDKTKNNWDERDNFVAQSGKYTLLEIDEDDEEEEEVEEKKPSVVDGKAVAPCSLDPQTQRLIEMIFDDNMFNGAMQQLELDIKKMPLGKLSKLQIAKGFDALVAIEDAIKANKPHKTLEELTSKFFTLIPHSFGWRRPPVINTLDLVRMKKDMLLVLSDIELAQGLKKEKADDVVGDGTLHPHPLDEKYERLCCKLSPLSKSSDEYKVISKYVASTKCGGVSLKHVWEVDRDHEGERFKEHGAIKYRKLLWHGTNVAVVAAILSSGLRIMPHSGGRVGKGIYFASEHSKSFGYACGAPDGTVVMFLNEVALGKEHTITQDDGSLTKPPKGYDSVVARGSNEPDPKLDTKITLDGQTVVVPQGKPIATQYNDSYFNQSEYLVYQESQVRIRYLLTF